MKAKVIELSTYTGLTPSMARVSQVMWDEIWTAIEKAQAEGMSTGCVVSSLEVIKVTVINDYLNGDA